MNNIEILEEFANKYRKIEQNHIDYLFSSKDKDIPIQAIENLIEENKELKEKVKGMYDKSNKLIEVTNLYLNSIPKSKVKEKIEELIREGDYRTADNPRGRIHFHKEDLDYKIEVLQELLED